MKKLFFTLSLIILGLSAANAQDSDLKANAGNITLEANFAPFGGSPLSIDYIRLRSFMSESVAFRLGLGLSVTSNYPNDNITTRTSSFTITPGIEKHFAGTNRLSPYIGAELFISNRSVRSEERNPFTNNITITHNAGGNGAFTLGLNGLAGADYYFSKHVYLGMELGYGFRFDNIKDTRVEGGATIARGSSFSFGESINGRLRLGFVLF